MSGVEKTAEGLIAYCRAQVGKPYWMGTFGQIATAALYAYNKARLPGDYQWSDMPDQLGQRVHDCVGLIKGYCWSDGPEAVPVYGSNGCPDISADVMYSRCSPRGELSTLPEVPGMLLFKRGHVGVYIGRGEVIEAAGHRVGVVRRSISDNHWTHWGKCPYIKYEEDDNMTGEQINKELSEFTAAQPESDWSATEGSFAKAKAAGVMDGTKPRGYVTREQLAAVLARLGMLDEQTK